MASAVLPFCLIAFATVVLSQDSTPSPASAAPSNVTAVTASGSSQATHTITVGKGCVFLGCIHDFAEG